MTEFNSFNNSSGSGKNLFGLMFVIALALHAGVLMIPTGEKPKTPDASKADTKQAKVEPAASPSPQANPGKSPEKSSKEETKKTEVATDSKTTEAEASVSPSPKSTSETASEENPQNNSGEAKDKATPDNDTSDKETSSDNDIVKQLRDRVRTKLLASDNSDSALVDKFIDSLPIAEVTEENAPYFFEGDALKTGTRGAVGIAQTETKIAYSQYIEPILKNQLGFEIEEISEGYGGEKLYKGQNTEGVEIYLSLVGVGTPNPSETLVVIWEKDPRGTSESSQSVSLD